MKIYKLKSSVHKRIKQTILKYVEYSVVMVDGGFTAKFVCLSELEKKTVLKEGFMSQ
jgi:hypothetical protein